MLFDKPEISRSASLQEMKPLTSPNSSIGSYDHAHTFSEMPGISPPSYFHLPSPVNSQDTLPIPDLPRKPSDEWKATEQSIMSTNVSMIMDKWREMEKGKQKYYFLF